MSQHRASIALLGWLGLRAKQKMQVVTIRAAEAADNPGLAESVLEPRSL